MTQQRSQILNYIVSSLATLAFGAGAYSFNALRTDLHKEGELRRMDGAEIRSELRSATRDLQDLRVQLATIPQTVQQVEDHEQRLRRLETR